MGPKIRVGLLLAAASCVLAVLVDWVVEELTSEAPQDSAEAPQMSEAPQASADTPEAGVEAPHEDTGEAQAVLEGSQGQD